LLFQVSLADPLTLAAATLGLSVVALLATLIPARRATRVNPVIALRSQVHAREDAPCVNQRAVRGVLTACRSSRVGCAIVASRSSNIAGARGFVK
jgi:predicted lysophospholipase L1 biosynthesis ABC-type transport system permease subunit